MPAPCSTMAPSAPARLTFDAHSPSLGCAAQAHPSSSVSLHGVKAALMDNEALTVVPVQSLAQVVRDARHSGALAEQECTLELQRGMRMQQMLPPMLRDKLRQQDGDDGVPLRLAPLNSLDVAQNGP